MPFPLLAALILAAEPSGAEAGAAQPATAQPALAQAVPAPPATAPAADQPSSGQAATAQQPSSEQAATAQPAAGQASGGQPAAAPGSAEEQGKLEEEIARELGVKPGEAAAPSAAGGTAAPPPPAAQGTTGGSPFARVLLLPDISAIGSFAAVYYERDVATESPRDQSLVAPGGRLTPLFQELELGLQSVVDPYARADVFISFGPGSVDVEEAYVTTLALPAGLQIRAGKLKSPFGRLNQQHPHVWDFVDGPLGTSRLLGADGLSGPGADLAWLVPVPWFAELHVAWQEVHPAWATEDRSTGFARLAQFFDLAEGVSLGVGLSHAADLMILGGSRTLSGADLFLKIRPPAGRAYLALQGEVVAHNLGAVGSGAEVGGYGQAVWRFSKFWAVGGRYDDAPVLGGGREQRWSALGSYFPSEFMRLRLQGSWDRLPGRRDGPEVILHLEFAIGAHGAHPF